MLLRKIRFILACMVVFVFLVNLRFHFKSISFLVATITLCLIGLGVLITIDLYRCLNLIIISIEKKSFVRAERKLVDTFFLEYAEYAREKYGVRYYKTLTIIGNRDDAARLTRILEAVETNIPNNNIFNKRYLVGFIKCLRSLAFEDKWIVFNEKKLAEWDKNVYKLISEIIYIRILSRMEFKGVSQYRLEKKALKNRIADMIARRIAYMEKHRNHAVHKDESDAAAEM